MVNNIDEKKILVIENDDENYADLLACLPTPFKPDHRSAVDDNTIQELKGSDYILCVSDILDIDSIAEGYSLDSPEVFESLQRGINRIAKIRQQLCCGLVMVTKIPAIYLRDHFKKFDRANSDMKVLFGNDVIEKLESELDYNKERLFGTVYKNKETQVYITIKHNLAKGQPDLNKTTWEKEVTKLLHEIYTRNILIIESDENKYRDIQACLPKSFISEHKTKINENAIDELKNRDYALCISDFLDIDSIAEGYSLDSQEIFESMKRGIKRLSKLRQHLGCCLVLITKIPVRHLIYHFDKLTDDPDMRIIFSDDIVNLHEELDKNINLPFGIAYSNKKTRFHIVVKNYLATGQADDNIKEWQWDLTELLKELYLLD